MDALERGQIWMFTYRRGNVLCISIGEAKSLLGAVFCISVSGAKSLLGVVSRCSFFSLAIVKPLWVLLFFIGPVDFFIVTPTACTDTHGNKIIKSFCAHCVFSCDLVRLCSLSSRYKCRKIVVILDVEVYNLFPCKHYARLA